jgi:hypothetical protein
LKRAAEEAQGVVHWLRPEFQNPAMTTCTCPSWLSPFCCAVSGTAAHKETSALRLRAGPKTLVVRNEHLDKFGERVHIIGIGLTEKNLTIPRIKSEFVRFL